MSLLDAFMTPCCYMEKTRVPDGAGGYIPTWREGEKFDAAITRDTTLTAQIAEKDGVTSIYTVTVDKGVFLEFHDVFKRIKDGRIFRITSDHGDVEAPMVASPSVARISQYKAEKWELTT